LGAVGVSSREYPPDSLLLEWDQARPALARCLLGWFEQEVDNVEGFASSRLPPSGDSPGWIAPARRGVR
jgi:hypothetical protein